MIQMAWLWLRHQSGSAIRADHQKALIVGLKVAPGSPGLIWATKSEVKAESTFACNATQTFEAGFLGRYLLDLCSYANTERLTLYQSTATAPALFVATPGEVQIVMPCRIQPYHAMMELTDD